MQNKKTKLYMLIERIIKEEISNKLTINVGGTRYEITRNGNVKRLGSEAMDYGANFNFLGATANYGYGNRRFTKSDIEITIDEVFANPEILVDKFPICSLDGKLGMYLGDRSSNKESYHKVLWVK